MTEPTTAWYRRPGVLAVLAIGVLGLGFGVGLLLSSGDDDGDRVGTTGTTAPVTTAAPTPTTTVVPTTVTPTTLVDDVAACEDGDQVSCDRLDDDQLQAFCDDGNVDACQVLLARQGDGVPDGPDGEGEGNGRGNGNGNGNGHDDDEEGG